MTLIFISLTGMLTCVAAAIAATTGRWVEFLPSANLAALLMLANLAIRFYERK